MTNRDSIRSKSEEATGLSVKHANGIMSVLSRANRRSTMPASIKLMQLSRRARREPDAGA